MNEQSLLSVKEVAQQLGLTEWAVRQHIKRGLMDSYKLGSKYGGRVRISQQQVDDYLKKHVRLNPNGR